MSAGQAFAELRLARSSKQQYTEKMTNRLAQEKSPYLLQHAGNPVDWYAWGDEAFTKARKEQKPVFLSIGYSTCHWCHVMEEESFENRTIADFLNQHFVSIKVDREERPDVDHVYMQAVMAMAGAGGWPLSVFLTPEGKPFYGGTYFPPEDRWGRAGFMTVLKALAGKWQTERKAVEDAGEQMAAALKEAVAEQTAAEAPLDESTLRTAFEQFQGQFDTTFGGFGPAPKFPRPHILGFLLRYAKRANEAMAQRMVEETLEAMSRGGLFDPLEGGFHRYSTDGEWHVPHFEKMLYDQALLARAYLEAFQVTKNGAYAATARRVLDYVRARMEHPAGGFYSAEDADSAGDPANPKHKTEGAFYIWTEAEIREALGDDADLFCFHYDVRPGGNAEHDPMGEFKGKNILREIRTREETAAQFKKNPADVHTALEAARAILKKKRDERLRPHLDDKILTDWNGLMIGALALGARVLGEPAYAESARRAADFVLTKLQTAEGRLLHRWRDGEAAVPGFLDDYAFLIDGLLELYQTQFEARDLEKACTLVREMLRLFRDEKQGGFFISGADAEALIARGKDLYDGALPSGNSVAVSVLLRLARLTGERKWEAAAEAALTAFAATVRRFPSGYPQLLMALDFQLGPSGEIVVAGARDEAVTAALLKIVEQTFLPRHVVALHPVTTEEALQIEKILPFVEKQTTVQGKPAVYVCENHTCREPVTDAAALASILK